MSVRLAACWSVAFLGLLTAVTSSAEDAPDPPADAHVSRNVRDTMQQVWSGHVRAPDDGGPRQTLQQAVDRLQAIRLVPADASALAKAREDQESSPGRRRPTTRPASRPTTIPSSLLADLQKRPSVAVADPAGMGDALRLAGYAELAARFYEMAEASGTDEDEKAWRLFQTANCLREIRPATATATYQKLISQHPDSLWGQIGRIQTQVLQWRRSSDVAKALDRADKETVEQPGAGERRSD